MAADRKFARLVAVHGGDPTKGCSIPGCTRLTAQSAGTGLAAFHCRYHVQHKARHGSYWHGTYRADDLKPFRKAAARWIAEHRSDFLVASAITGLQYLLAFAGRAEPAMNLRRVPAARRARIAFARMYDANVKPTRLLEIYLAVSALIEEDRGSHRTDEFRIVQVAKAAHRLASGTHRKWDMWAGGDRFVPFALHVYPRSSGIVLRKIGEALEKECEPVAKEVTKVIVAAKVERFGPHPSHLPGWRQPGFRHPNAMSKKQSNVRPSG